MNKNYTLPFMSTLLVLSLASASHAQSTKTKTITIINGDTTISENNIDNKDVDKMEKEIQVMMTDDGDDSGKKVVKKIIINDEKNDGESMGYAYAYGENSNDVQVTTSDDGTETKIVIKNGEGKNSSTKTKVVKKGGKTEGVSTEKSTMNISISIKNTTAKVDIETSSKEPMNVSILDENGKQIFYDSQKTGGKYSKEIPLEKKGTYFLNFIQNKTSKTEKIIVE